MRIAGENIKINENSLVINYDDYGPIYAPAVIFIHGFPFNKSMWHMQLEALKSNYRVISYDVRGFGDSTSPFNNHSLETLTGDLMQLMDKLLLKKATLCGLSMGGYIALNAVEKYTERFNGLLLCDVHCSESIQETRAERLNIIQSIRKYGLKYFADKSLKYFFASPSFIKKREQVKAARKMIMATSINSICDTLLTLDPKNGPCVKLTEIKIPVLIVVGKEDAHNNSEEVKNLQKKIPGSNLIIIEYSGHLPNLENTEEFNRHLKIFMDKISLRRGLSEQALEYKP